MRNGIALVAIITVCGCGNDSRNADLQKRIEGLETQVNRLQADLERLADADEKPDKSAVDNSGVVRARGIEIVDDQGQVRLQIGRVEHTSFRIPYSGYGLSVHDAEKRNRVFLFFDEKRRAGRFYLLDEENKPHVSMVGAELKVGKVSLQGGRSNVVRADAFVRNQ